MEDGLTLVAFTSTAGISIQHGLPTGGGVQAAEDMIGKGCGLE